MFFGVSIRTRDHFLEAGLDLLAEGGVSAVTIAALCDRLGVTKGSFYHRFDDVAAFHAALLSSWEAGTHAPELRRRAVAAFST